MTLVTPRTVSFALLLLAATAGAARAQIVHSFDDLAVSGRLKPGDAITLRGPMGEEARGEFRGWRSGTLELYVPRERRLAIFKEAEVLRIARDARHGVAWGAAIGAGSAAAITAAAAASYGENEGGRFCGNCFLQWGLVAIPAGAGIGAGIGFAIDRLRRTPLFEALPKSSRIGVTPMLSRRATGLQLSIEF